jgi:hypothetical protein
MSKNDGATTSPKVINQGQVSMLRPSPINLSPNQVGWLVIKKGIKAPRKGAIFVKITPSSHMQKGKGGRPKKKGDVTFETPHKESEGINLGIIISPKDKLLF